MIAIDDSKRKIKGQVGGISAKGMKIIAESHPSRVLSSYRVFFCLAGLFIRAKVVKCPQRALRAFWRSRAKIMLMDDSALCMRVALFVSLKSQGAVINEELARDATKR